MGYLRPLKQILMSRIPPIIFTELYCFLVQVFVFYTNRKIGAVIAIL